MGKLKVTEQLLKQLEAEGYSVKRKADLERKTFLVEKEALKEFLKAREKAGIKIQDAVTEALSDWTKKRR